MKNTVLSTLFFFCLHSLWAQNVKLTDALPLDPQVKAGRLSNGMTYYIRKNTEPEKRAELRLVINAGSVLESDKQQGLAHFAEHMCFNGSKNFPKSELVDYLESIGMRFGPDLNAYTSFDETVYMLQIPTDSLAILEKGVQILEEWAKNVQFTAEEIDKERGVVGEEWRLGQGANSRMRNQYFPVLYKNSQYAVRLPIGQKAVIDTCNYEALRCFYRDWYRPNLASVIAVGDFDPAQVEKWIIERFKDWQNPQKAPERKLFPVPDTDGTDAIVVSDAEAQSSVFMIRYKQPIKEIVTVKDYRDQLMLSSLLSAMLNNRLDEVKRKPEAPFSYARVAQGAMCRTKNAFGMTLVLNPDNMTRSIETAMTEIERVRRHGFTATELARLKKDFLSNLEQSYNERENTASRNLATEYIENFLENSPAPGVEYEYRLYKQLLDGISLNEINSLTQKWITKTNRTIILAGVKKDGLKLPTEADLLTLINKLENAKIEPYVDTFVDKPLIEKAPKAGKVAETKTIAALNVTEWRLSNGVKVVLKPTDFKSDEVLMYAQSPGGYSVSKQAIDMSAKFADNIAEQGGVGGFDLTQLEKALQGKQVSVSPYIEQLNEGFSGNSSAKDLETLLQLTYLYFTQPRRDDPAIKSFIKRLETQVMNKANSPETVYRDTFNLIMNNFHPRARPLSVETLKEVKIEDGFAFYKDRFADASDFTFIFVGSFNPETIKPLVETYLGSLPSTKRKENWVDWNMAPPKGVVKKTVRKGVEPKSIVSMAFTGDFDWTRENRIGLDLACRVVSIKLREAMREDKGGTYSVRAAGRAEHFPKNVYTISIGFGCSPDKVEELIQTAFAQIKTIQTNGPDAKDLVKVKEAMRRERELALKDNNFWLNNLAYLYWNEMDPALLNLYNEVVDGFSAAQIQDLTKRFFNFENYVEVDLKPEK